MFSSPRFIFICSFAQLFILMLLLPQFLWLLFQVAVLCGSVVSLCSFWGVLMVVGQNGFDVLISSISSFTPGGTCLYWIIHTHSPCQTHDFSINSSPPRVCREGCSVIPLCDTSLPNPLSIYLCPWWLKPIIPNRGDLSGPSACVSLPLTSGPFLSAPDLSTSLRGSHIEGGRSKGWGWGERGDRKWGKTREKGGCKGERATRRDGRSKCSV